MTLDNQSRQGPLNPEMTRTRTKITSLDSKFIADSEYRNINLIDEVIIEKIS